MNIIEHPGIILAISPDTISVKIIAHSACANCHARKSCGVSESQEKIIEVENCYQKGQFQINQQVNVILMQVQGFYALFWGYLLPFILVLLVLILAHYITHDDSISGISALLILFPYYFVLFLLRNRLKKSFKFTLKNLCN